ncbi:hypothetical protein EYF80_042140 [Liparis tanakae]|uniref:Uncharacterized protein n=1 Tax=Liparis tanakae TaxID=230148 RepID=A0A4Z2G3C9_9TELE|nr:hypothetical protein EYF80_042140 [Liparis tanakae]
MSPENEAEEAVASALCLPALAAKDGWMPRSAARPSADFPFGLSELAAKASLRGAASEPSCESESARSRSDASCCSCSLTRPRFTFNTWRHHGGTLGSLLSSLGGVAKCFLFLGRPLPRLLAQISLLLPVGALQLGQVDAVFHFHRVQHVNGQFTVQLQRKGGGGTTRRMCSISRWAIWLSSAIPSSATISSAPVLLPCAPMEACPMSVRVGSVSGRAWAISLAASRANIPAMGNKLVFDGSSFCGLTSASSSLEWRRWAEWAGWAGWAEGNGGAAVAGERERWGGTTSVFAAEAAGT